MHLYETNFALYPVRFTTKMAHTKKAAHTKMAHTKMAHTEMKLTSNESFLNCL